MTTFYKYHGTGNDFIMVDGRHNAEIPAASEIAKICHRNFGIGADGLIVVVPREDYDFEMIYFNSDGSPARMCGNGARCAAAFASSLGICGKKAIFMAGDGPHAAEIEKVSEHDFTVKISMVDVVIPSEFGNQTEINTGTPHLVKIVPDTEKINVLAEGRKIRFSAIYSEAGINIDWLGMGNGILKVRTYERGVENETLSCGTGVTACAVVAALTTGKTSWEVETLGGTLWVDMKIHAGLVSEITLKGPAKFVFKGEIVIPLA